MKVGQKVKVSDPGNRSKPFIGIVHEIIDGRVTKVARPVGNRTDIINVIGLVVTAIKLIDQVWPILKKWYYDIREAINKRM